MKIANVFPGQGSQQLGMGEDLFDCFPELVEQTNSLLGYDIKDLCLNGPERKLSRTQYTQPALYLVNAMSYLKCLNDGERQPDYLAGHSLGEYNALFAAGAFDFLTGLRLVQKRGELMALANDINSQENKKQQGAMAAVIGLPLPKLLSIIKESDIALEIANVNSPTQIIVSGKKEVIEKGESIVSSLGAKYVQLNVSAAFHSSLMNDAAEQYSEFIEGIEFKPLEIDVISNYTARPYPRENYKTLLVKQITGTVDWYGSVSWLLANRVSRIEELGPGMVLTKLTAAIKQDPQNLRENEKEPKNHPVSKDVRGTEAASKIIFMYGGQGFHYFKMGAELFETREVFRSCMLSCDELILQHIGYSIIDAFFEGEEGAGNMDNVLVTHPAIFSFGYCLTKELESRGIKPDAVLGYSLGEYVAAVIAGAVAFEDAVRIVCEQAKLLKLKAENGAMLAVLTQKDDFSKNAPDYDGASLACINYGDNFIVSGESQAIHVVQQNLKKRSILTVRLPVAHSFHSEHVEVIRESFKELAEKVDVVEPELTLYSSSANDELLAFGFNEMWNAIRQPLDFQSLVEKIKALGEYKFIDLSPTASLSAFLDRTFGKNNEHLFAIDQFGNNRETVNKLIKSVA